ncbi:FtsX-like permease family protein [Phytohabitans houttuyneae]|uniref:Uncharacterized protein n=1 Tax=Phytohabitans houttuyneae TaxID=1076126 RepID=A0A6V8KHV8_9ACTN|nr:FtsX-like permease family protein [Phytohabitans houttuyneae]GFJ83000.1 hypothetical protein Phou_071800 [Phytohabitans houttuyneae]
MRASATVIGRLAWRNLRHRPGQAVLLLLALCLATTTLSLALAVDGAGDRSWERVWHDTNGPHVQASMAWGAGRSPGDRALQRARASLVALTTAPGVVAAAGPLDAMVTTGEVAGDRMELEVLVRDAAPAAVGQPKVTAGRWLDGGDGVVLEEGLASTMRVGPGDTVTVAGRSLPVRGVAMTATTGRFPMYQPGRIWVSEPTAARIDTGQVEMFATEVQLRLAPGGDASAFVAAHAPPPPPGGFQRFGMSTWEEMRAGSHDDLSAFAVALVGIGVLLGLLTIATAAVLVASRMAAQIRQVGTLKAIGVTPGQVTLVLLTEYLSVAGLAAAVGLAAGQLLTPALAGVSLSLYGTPQAPPLTWERAALVLAVAVAVVLLATVRPALRGARRSTLRSLTMSARPPRRASRAGRVAARLGLPLPVVLGLRSALRRPGRALANAAGLTLGVTMVVIGLGLDRGVHLFMAEQTPDEVEAPGGELVAEVVDRIVTVVYAGAGLLLALAAINAVVVAVFAARDSARNHAVLRTVGATPRQTVAAFVVAQLGGCLLACAAGIPLGVLIFNGTLDSDLTPIRLPLSTYAAVALGVPLVYAAIVAVPAVLFGRRPVTPLLSYQ